MLENRLQRLPAGEAGICFMPPLDFVAVAELPAEEYEVAAAHCREIDQAAGVVL